MQDIILQNLLSPMILFFLIGIIAVLVNSDLKVPEAIYAGYTMIILVTIGIKGGKQLRNFDIGELFLPLLSAIILSFIMLGLTYVTLRFLFKFKFEDSIAVAAHYGSVSAVTFAAGLSFLEKLEIPYESYISTLLVIMEGPAIILAIIFYKLRMQPSQITSGLGPIIKEAFFGKSIFLLIGGMVIGMVSSEEGLHKIQPLFGDLFYGVLCIFLLHMGMMACTQFSTLKGQKWYKFSFALFIPVIGGIIGTGVGALIGLSVGGTFMLGLLSASASYIAAPASISHSIPEANSGLYLGSSLGITLPFNLIVGIPFYYYLAQVFN